jgi:adenylate cyclase
VASHQCLVLAVKKSTQQQVQRWVELLDLNARWVLSHQELLSEAETGNYTLVVVDGVDAQSLTLCRTLKSQQSTALIPLVFMAAHSMLRIAAYEAGVDAAFLASSERDIVMARIRSLLRHAERWHFLTESKLQLGRRHEHLLRNTLYRYVSPQIADRLLVMAASNAEQMKAGTRAQVAVLFADMRGFTGIAERLSAAQVFELLNEFFSTLTAVAFRHEGTVFNMAGDSLMVGFGAPIPQTDGGARAVKAAREMLVAFAVLAEQWRNRYGIETGLGIGINEGEVIAGNVGSDEHMSYTLIGDTVNVAARLSQRARAGEVLFSTSLKLTLDAQSSAEMKVTALPPLTLRGRASPVSIYCVPTDRRIEIHH